MREKIITRIYQIIDYKNVKVKDFEQANNLTNGYLRNMRNNNSDMGESIIAQIIENNPDISLDWLLTGRGEMLRDGVASGHNESGTQQIIQGNNNRNNSVTVGPQTVAELQKAIEEKDNTIRLQAETIARLSQIIGK